MMKETPICQGSCRVQSFPGGVPLVGEKVCPIMVFSKIWTVSDKI